MMNVVTHKPNWLAKKMLSGCILAAVCSVMLHAQERKVEVIPALLKSVKLDEPIDMHLTDADKPLGEEVKINLKSEDAWVFFDHIKPNEVLDKFSDNILVNGKQLDLETNARLAIYRQGAIVIPQSPDYYALSTYTKPGFKGDREQYRCNNFYTNSAPEYAPEGLVRPLRQDNTIRSLRLKRGYMATLANDADGMGYSRVFIADTADLELSELPALLDGKVSYVRVMRWQYVSKKGWAGSVWTSMPEGLKYVGEQSDLTNSTWYYNWSATTDWTTNPNAVRRSLNQEFVPEKWGAGGDFSQLYDIEEATHLMAYNEPDHTEQSNVSVEKAIEEWPLLQQTGYRLGSPATTDFNWLYNFMSEAKKKNYRVDYVVVHAYWGGLSAKEWYDRLREVHERTGRPIWIKEWNNGANWTHEGWPSGTEEQQAKQLRDLKEILTVMDTASFIERYSIYNWVEDKRAIILPDAKLSPAGEYYKDNNPGYFFSHDKEVIPVWTVRTAPLLSYGGITADGAVRLVWGDENMELIDHYIVEYSFSSDFSNPSIATLLETDGFTGKKEMECRLPLSASMDKGFFCRVKSVPMSGSEKSSNVVSVGCVPNKADKPFLHETCITGNWSPMLFAAPYSEQPVVLLGIPTYRNKMPLGSRIREVMPRSFDFRLTTWDYQLSPSFVNPDTVAFAVLPCRDGHSEFDWNGVNAQVAIAENVGTQWQKVSFGRCFDVVPVVIPCQTSEHFASAASVRVRNVTEDGFEVCLRFEGRSVSSAEWETVGASVAETVSFLALTPGIGEIDGRKVLVGLTEDAAVGDNLLGGYTVDYSAAEFSAVPLMFGAMQTEEDTITSTLRVKSRNNLSAVIFKDREKSVSYERVKPEKVGWMVVEREAEEEVDNVSKLLPDTERKLSYSMYSGCIFSDDRQDIGRIEILDLQGRIVASACNVPSLSLSCLPKGIYVVMADGCDRLKIIK